MAITLPLEPTPDDLRHLETIVAARNGVEAQTLAGPIRERIIIERAIVRRAVTDLLAAGYEIRVYYGDGEYGTGWENKVDPIMQAICACDEELLRVRHGRATRDAGSVTLVYGNDGWDVMADYSLSIEDSLKGANELADEIANAVQGVSDTMENAERRMGC